MSHTSRRSSRSSVAFQFDLLKQYPHPLRHGLSGRVRGAPQDGDIGYSDDTDPDDIADNRRAFLTDLEIDPDSLTLGEQAHGSSIAVVGANDRGRGRPPESDAFPATDGLVTDQPGIAPGVIVADCVPLVLYDPVRRVLGVIHAGWRGTVALIASKAVRVMVDDFGSSPSDILAGIGPSIGPCCYEVGDEVIDAWRTAAPDMSASAVVTGRGGVHFDLWTANRLVLESAGLQSAHIEVSAVCVHCEVERFFSHRAAVAGRATGGRMMMVARLEPLPGRYGGA